MVIYASFCLCVTFRFADYTRDKTSLDITWIKAGGEEEQFTLEELMTNITTQASNISKAVAELQKLMDGIKE